MNYKSITTAIVVVALGLSACDNKNTQDTKTQAQPEPEVPMSAEPAEPTGVMNAEPVVLETDEATSATDATSDAPASSQ